MTQEKHNSTHEKYNLVTSIKEIISNSEVPTQECLMDLLRVRGLNVTQSMISRTLTQIGVSKYPNKEGKLVYHIPWEQSSPTPTHDLQSMVVHITRNDNIIVVQTSPGAAPLVARLLDYEKNELAVLGTIAGDDTIFVAPQLVAEIERTYKGIKSRLFSSD